MEDYKDLDESIGVPHDSILVLDMISRGRTFSVFKARRSTKFVTLKVANQPDAMHTELLRREYELSSTLSHGCIATTLAFEEDTELGAAIVMEYIEGVSLDKFIASNPSRKARERVMRDILDGVEYLHHRGLLHNDLKPQNIIINSCGAARIIDFGLSASEDSLWSGCIGGSNTFSAPEIMSGKGVANAASDIYSVGKLVAFVFDNNRYGRIVNRCIEEDPELRYGSITELRHAIVGRRRLLYVAVGALFATAVTLYLVVIFASSTPPLQPTAQTVESFEDEDRYGEVLATSANQYSTALQIIKTYPYKEFAIVVRGLYLLEIGEYIAQLSSEEGAVVGKQFIQNINHFDSLALSLPTIEDKPVAQRDSLMILLDTVVAQQQRRLSKD
jgi:serine/threonine protein kinase